MGDLQESGEGLGQGSFFLIAGVPQAKGSQRAPTGHIQFSIAGPLKAMLWLFVRG